MAPGPLLEPGHLPPELHLLPARKNATITTAPVTQGLENAVIELEQQLIRQALAQAEGNVVKAALLLKIPRGTLRYKMEKYGL
jgi:DNA-binding NtrC family response regulator